MKPRKSPKMSAVSVIFFAKIFFKTLAIFFLVVAAIFVFCSFIFHEGGYYKGNISDHFDGKKFFNPSDQTPHEKSVFGYFLSKRAYEKTHGKPVWKSDEVIANNAFLQAKPAIKIDDDSIAATYVGHSTFLLQLEGINILTDPIWSDRASPISFLGPKRIKAPGIKFEDLPKIDLVLISHSHYDHMDLPTIKLLKNHSNPKFLLGLGSCNYLNKIKGLDLDCVELDWNEKFYFSEKLIVNFLPAKHWSKRSFFGANAMLWGAFAIESKAGKIYFAGDTGYGEHFKEAFENFGEFDLALLPIGAYKPQDFMIKNHISPKQAVQAHFDLGAKNSIAMHYETFQLASDNFLDPRNELEIAKKEKKLTDKFNLLAVGNSQIIKINF